MPHHRHPRLYLFAIYLSCPRPSLSHSCSIHICQFVTLAFKCLLHLQNTIITCVQFIINTFFPIAMSRVHIYIIQPMSSSKFSRKCMHIYRFNGDCLQCATQMHSYIDGAVHKGFLLRSTVTYYRMLTIELKNASVKIQLQFAMDTECSGSYLFL